MDYKIPDNIKVLCEKQDLSDPEEQELVKQEFVKFLIHYLDLKKGKNSLANITDIVTNEFPVKGTVYPFERDVAGRMVRTRNYTMKEGINKAGKEEVYVIAVDRPWWERYNPLQTFGGVVLGTTLSFIGTKINNLEKQETPLTKTNIEDTRIQPLFDSLKVLTSKVEALEDSLKNTKQD